MASLYARHPEENRIRNSRLASSPPPQAARRDPPGLTGATPAAAPRQNKPRGFIEYERNPEPYRPAAERLQDYHEINAKHEALELKRQAARCMDCGTPFCQTHTGCPISNLIPEFNNLVFEEQWKEAYVNLTSTNNFPEFTGRVCPAPCEGACVAGIADHIDGDRNAITIKNMEHTIIEKAWENGWVVPRPPKVRSGKTVAVVGSGPAGMAAADQLNKAGHLVTVYERQAKVGGLLTYGIPNMKLSKATVERRVKVMEQEGITFLTNQEVGADAAELKTMYDATVLATGSTVPNNLPIPGRQLDGVVFAMDFLTKNQQRLFADKRALGSAAQLVSKYDGSIIDATGKNVIVIGGGDTGTDCIATSLRHGCASLTNFELFPQPPKDRGGNNPWPLWPRILRTDYGHEEAAYRDGADPRVYSVLSKEFVGDADGKLTSVRTVQVAVGADGHFQEVEGSEKEWPADLVILAMGFRHPELLVAETLRVGLDARNNYKANTRDYKTNVDGVFAAGDCRRGQSLVVWAINEGRGAAAAADSFLRQAAQ